MVPPGDFTTLIALRAKRGELEALNALEEPTQVRHVQPLIQLVAGGASPVDQLRRIEVVTRKLHQLQRHVMIDAAEVLSLAGFGGDPARVLGPLIDSLAHPVDLFESESPAAFVPVVRTDATADMIASTRRLCAELGLGCAVRICPPVESTDHIAQVMEQLGVDTREVDAIIDVQYVKDVNALLIDRVSAVLAGLTSLGTFRSTTVLAGSIPRTLMQNPMWQQPRFEELLWEAVRDTGQRHVRFGDYGIVHPLPSRGFRSHHVSMKYTCQDRWTYLRQSMDTDAESVTDQSDWSPRAHAFRLVCQHLAGSDIFAGPDFSWGDRQIHEAAARARPGLGATSKPVAVGTSHHLACLAIHAAA